MRKLIIIVVGVIAALAILADVGSRMDDVETVETTEFNRCDATPEALEAAFLAAREAILPFVDTTYSVEFKDYNDMAAHWQRQCSFLIASRVTAFFPSVGIRERIYSLTLDYSPETGEYAASDILITRGP